MALNYGINNAVDFDSSKIMMFASIYSRTMGQPMDKTQLWYPLDGKTGYERACEYAATTSAYVGQELAVVDVVYEEDGTTVRSTSVKFYGIQDANGTLKELGAIPVGDESTIEVDTEGKISLKGVADLTFERDVIGEDGTATGTKEEIKYQALLTKDGLTWVEPSKTTVEGLASLISALESKTAQLETDIADNAAAITAETTAREAADKAITDSIGTITEGSTVVGMIEAALAEAKKYADDNDTDTIYDDTDVKARLKAIEDDYLKEADKYDDTEIKDDIADHESRIGAVETAIGNSTQGLIKDIADERAARAQGDIDTLAAAKTYTNEEITGLDITIEKKTVENVESDYIVIKNKSGVEVASVNAAKFVKDGMLDSAVYSTETKKLTLTWNTDAGKSATELDLNELVNTYTSGNHIIVDETGKISIADDVVIESELTALDTRLSAAIATKRTETEVDAQIDAKITAANLGQYAVAETVNAAIAEKADKEAYEQFVADYATDKTTFATKTDLENKVDTTTYTNDMAKVASTEYVDGQFTSMGQRLDGINQTIEDNAATVTNTLKDYAKTSDVTTTLEDYYTKEEVYTKGETDNKIDAKIASVTGGESAADVKSALESYRDALNTELWGSEASAWTSTVEENGKTKVVYNPNYTKTSRIDTIENEIGQIKAKNDAQDATLGEHTSTIATQGGQISDLQSSTSTLSSSYEGLNSKITTDIAPRLTTVEATLNGSGENTGLVGAVTAHTTEIANLKTRDSELAALIQGNTNKFADYYTAEQVDAKIGNIDYTDFVTDSEFTSYTMVTDAALAEKAVATEVAADFEAVNAEIAKKADKTELANYYTKDEANAEFMTEAEVKTIVDTVIADAVNTDTLEGLVDLVEYVHENAGELAKLVTDVENNGKAIEKNASDIAANKAAHENNAANILALTTTVAAQKVIESTEISATSVTGGVELGIKEVNVNKLVQTTNDVLILNGGSANA